MRIVVKAGVWKNTEDEILKAAVMKYGNGLEFLLYLFVNLLSNVRLVGMNGLTLISERRSGLEKRMKNCFIWRSLCQHNEQLLQLLVELHLIVLSDMRNSLMQLVLEMKIKSLVMIPGNYVRERLTLTLCQSLHVQILLIWMRMRRKCFLKLEFD